MNDPEFRERFSGRYFGLYRGFVVDVNDPKQLNRIKVKVPHVSGTDDPLGWALPSPNTGGADNVGDSWIPEAGTFVWVQFEDGDLTYPVWSPGPWAFRDGASQVPKHARGKYDLTDYSFREAGNVPPSQFAGEYSKVRTISGYDGSFLEFDGTSGEERVQLFHRTGTRIEISSDGGFQEIGIAGCKRSFIGEHNVQFGSERYLNKGKRIFQVDGLVEETYGGNITRTLSSLSETGKAYSGSWEGDYSISTSGNFGVSALNNGTLSFTGQLAFMVGANLQASVMETIELTASAATTGETSLSPLPAMTLHGYNGETIFKATDATGEIKECALTHDPAAVGTATSTWNVSVGPVTGGQIQLEETVATPTTPNVLLGSGASRQPVPMGDNLVELLTDLIMWIQNHTHPTGTGPSGPPIDPSPTLPTVLLPMLQTTLALPPGPTSLKSMYTVTS